MGQSPLPQIRGRPIYPNFGAQFVEAAVARLIPTDQHAGAIEAGVPNYLDKQLVGACGAGGRFYKAINAELNKSGRPFWEMSPDQQDEYLHK